MQKSFCFKHSGLHSQGKRNLMLFVSDGSAWSRLMVVKLILTMEKHHWQKHVHILKTIPQKDSLCVWASDAQSWEQLGRPYAFSVEHKCRWETTRKKLILTPEAKMSQFWIVYVLSWLSNKADDNHPRQHLSVKWETVRIIHLVIRRRDAIKHLQSVQSRLTPLGIYVEAYLFKKKLKIPSTFTHLPNSWKVETDHGLLVTFKLSSQIRSLVSANWAQIRDNVLIIVWNAATAKYLFFRRSHLLLSSRRFCWGLWSEMAHEKGWCSSSCSGKRSISLHKQNIQFSTHFQWFHIHEVNALKTNILLGVQSFQRC